MDSVVLGAPHDSILTFPCTPHTTFTYSQAWGRATPPHKQASHLDRSRGRTPGSALIISSTTRLFFADRYRCPAAPPRNATLASCTKDLRAR